MKRDMDLIRTIMIELESRLEPEKSLTELTFDGQDDHTVLEHLMLLEEAGFVSMTVERYLGGEPPFFVVHRITWAGHEFLESVRSDTVWEKSKKTLLTAGVGFAWPILQTVLRTQAAARLGLPL